MVESTKKRTIFLGTTTNKVDAKGRVSLPADFRSLVRDNETSVAIFRSFAKNCVEGMTIETMENLNADIRQNHDIFAEENDDLTSLIYADSEHIDFDSTGRFLLSKKMLEHAEINEKAVFVGLGAKFQIWNPENWEKELAAKRERAIKNRPQIKNKGE